MAGNDYSNKWTNIKPRIPVNFVLEDERVGYVSLLIFNNEQYTCSS